VIVLRQEEKDAHPLGAVRRRQPAVYRPRRFLFGRLDGDVPVRDRRHAAFGTPRRCRRPVSFGRHERRFDADGCSDGRRQAGCASRAEAVAPPARTAPRIVVPEHVPRAFQAPPRRNRPALVSVSTIPSLPAMCVPGSGPGRRDCRRVRDLSAEVLTAGCRQAPQASHGTSDGSWAGSCRRRRVRRRLVPAHASDKAR
jgi:hypothetical protein